MRKREEENIAFNEKLDKLMQEYFTLFEDLDCRSVTIHVKSGYLITISQVTEEQ